MRVFSNLDEFIAASGSDLGTSDWVLVDQKRIDQFAEATGDHQWIHVDPERAKDTPFGGTIAHGYFTVALAPMLGAQVLDFKGFAFGLNYGLDRVRFPSAMPVGGKVRCTVKLAEVTDIPGGVANYFEHELGHVHNARGVHAQWNKRISLTDEGSETVALRMDEVESGRLFVLETRGEIGIERRSHDIGVEVADRPLSLRLK